MPVCIVQCSTFAIRNIFPAPDIDCMCSASHAHQQLQEINTYVLAHAPLSLTPEIIYKEIHVSKSSRASAGANRTSMFYKGRTKGEKKKLYCLMFFFFFLQDELKLSYHH